MKYQFESKEIINCSKCPLKKETEFFARYRTHEEYLCSFNDKGIMGANLHMYKPDWCPLQEVPQEQGRH